jgi:hypothetical protein
MRKGLFVLCCAFAVACQKEATGPRPSRVTTTNVPADARNARIDTVIQPAPVFVDKSLLGNSVGADGNVAEEADHVDQGGKAYLTMFLHESPVGLKTQVKWSDRDKKEIHREEREMKGGKVVTFALDTKKLKPGTYHVEGYWGGNLAAEKDFEVGKGKK